MGNWFPSEGVTPWLKVGLEPIVANEERYFWRMFYEEQLQPFSEAPHHYTIVAGWKDKNSPGGRTVHYARISFDAEATQYDVKRCWKREGVPHRYYHDRDFVGWCDPITFA